MVSSVCCALPITLGYFQSVNKALEPLRTPRDRDRPPKIPAFSALNAVNSALYWMMWWQPWASASRLPVVCGTQLGVVFGHHRFRRP